MNYKETLKFAKENNIDVLKLKIAYELECTLDSEVEVSDEEFEKLCGAIEDAYLKSENLSIYHFTQAVKAMLDDEEMTVEDVISLNKWDLIDRATDYLY